MSRIEHLGWYDNPEGVAAGKQLVATFKGQHFNLSTPDGMGRAIRAYQAARLDSGAETMGLWGAPVVHDLVGILARWVNDTTTVHDRERLARWFARQK